MTAHLSNISFDSFDLHETLAKGIDDAGFDLCTPIQSLALPVALAGRDVAGQAQTGTGKTAAFVLPLLQLLGAPAGEASPFYFQPFYPYFLAAVHLLFGEDAFGVLFLQRLGLWASLFAVASTARALFVHANTVSLLRLADDERVSLSTKHTLAVTNRGGAATADLLELAGEVRGGVLARFGVRLENEPVLVGCAIPEESRPD